VNRTALAWTALALAAAAASGCSRAKATMSGPLISAKTTMVTAWEIPRNPTSDPTLGKSVLADQIRWGYKIFVDTPHEAARFTGGTVSCANCHLNAGQRERAMPLVAVAGMFPEYNNRAARLISLGDRVVDCFLRSENAVGRLGLNAAGDEGVEASATAADETLTPASKEVLAVSAYLAWLSQGYPVGVTPAWRGQNAVAQNKLVPIDGLDIRRGETVFMERCTSCHGENGQGVQIGDKKAGPLWGPASWNDGAGAARVYTLAGIIRYSMPYLDPGSLSDEDAQHVAAYITSKPRPVYPFKARDYAGGKVPVDAVYYRRTTSATH
jgi:thiosulfate dehydrogenase